ncbi:type VII secretion system-associated protein [Streptacidiphilus sp. ASG 303]|uniref:type VII secretion system-associated protein n=1 Tax=Streptacidiphilus sp. ASG 303 TaxID=2896847 RepID=UPI001E41F6D7|nr:type VII secretion system-associated protein [Streptacidiphilus sp. ASG 303]MCD0485491.1 type VII secretion system-associated protein [Streptacidiphilus sp. ASG 303]
MEDTPAGETGPPTATEEVRARARRSPGRWLYLVDPSYDPDGAVPPDGIAGAWEVDGEGAPVGFTANPGYRPSAQGLGLAAPTDPVDAVMQDAATGRAAYAEVLDALAGVSVYVPADSRGRLTAHRDGDGLFVAVLTDPRQGPDDVPQLLPVGLADLVAALPEETAVWINPHGGVSVGASVADLRAALGVRSGEPQTAEVGAIPLKGVAPGRR